MVEAPDADQECAPCRAGTECVRQPCTSCRPCQPGTFKTSEGSDACDICPRNTYNGKPESSSFADCLTCGPDGETVNTGSTKAEDCSCSAKTYQVILDGDASCKACPVGATCNDRSCALANNQACADTGATIIGTWSRDATSNEYVLVSCPAGYSKVTKVTGSNTFSHDAQRCLRCIKPFQYIINPNTDSCQICPVGLECDGTSLYTPTVENSTWAVNGSVFALQSCPSGYLLVNNLAKPSIQECQLCLPGTECKVLPCILCTSCSSGTYKVNPKPSKHNPYFEPHILGSVHSSIKILTLDPKLCRPLQRRTCALHAGKASTM
jgi:hypothetical protein